MPKFLYHILFTSLFFSVTVHAQTIKTDVLVIGGNTFGIAVAKQAVKSGVKAYLIEASASLGNRYEVKNIETNASRSDSLRKGLDTLKNLKILLKTQVKSMEKDGNKWKVRLTNGTKVISKAVVDAVPKKYKSVGDRDSSYDFRLYNSPDNYFTDNLYRTLVGYFPLKELIGTPGENFIDLKVLHRDIDGQAVGAVAAYCAFFETTTKKLDVRVIQGEILGYGGQLMGIDDINKADSNYLAIQRMAVTGIFKFFSFMPGGFTFRPEEKVNIQDITALREYFSRSKLWFEDNPKGELTLEKLLSLIKFIGSRGQELDREVEKGWKTSFKFKENYDLKRQLTRRETAVLIDAYLKPFNVKVNLDGRIML